MSEKTNPKKEVFEIISKAVEESAKTFESIIEEAKMKNPDLTVSFFVHASVENKDEISCKNRGSISQASIASAAKALFE